jgi:hypothetical protein
LDLETDWHQKLSQKISRLYFSWILEVSSLLITLVRQREVEEVYKALVYASPDKKCPVGQSSAYTLHDWQGEAGTWTQGPGKFVRVPEDNLLAWNG